MSEKVLTIRTAKECKFALDKAADVVDDLFEEISKNRVSEILKDVKDWYEKQDREAVNKCLMNKI